MIGLFIHPKFKQMHERDKLRQIDPENTHPDYIGTFASVDVYMSRMCKVQWRRKRKDKQK